MRKPIEPHWEVVRTHTPTPHSGVVPSDQFHGRRVVGDEITWSTETMARAVGVERSIASYIRDTLEAASFDLDIKVTLEWTGPEKAEKAIYVNGVFFPRRMLYVDERQGQS